MGGTGLILQGMNLRSMDFLMIWNPGFELFMALCSGCKVSEFFEGPRSKVFVFVFLWYIDFFACPHCKTEVEVFACLCWRCEVWTDWAITFNTSFLEICLQWMVPLCSVTSVFQGLNSGVLSWAFKARGLQTHWEEISKLFVGICVPNFKSEVFIRFWSFWESIFLHFEPIVFRVISFFLSIICVCSVMSFNSSWGSVPKLEVSNFFVVCCIICDWILKIFDLDVIFPDTERGLYPNI